MIDFQSELGGMVLFAIISALVLWIARRNGYFKPLEGDRWKPDINLWHVMAAFGIYFGIAILLPPFLIPFLKKSAFSNPVGPVCLLNLFISSLIFLGLAGLIRSLPQPVYSALWRSHGTKQPYSDDLKIAFATWLIAFPIVLFASQLLDVLVYLLFHVTHLPDQVAVYFVKMTFAHPLYFILALISIIILAPLVEEILFRGFLQTFIRKHLGSKHAILITSLCFSFFHFSPEQGLGNIPIVGSLFSLALFLGYIYERQQSLFAPMCLHAIFNTISVLNLYFLGGAPRGAL